MAADRGHDRVVPLFHSAAGYAIEDKPVTAARHDVSPPWHFRPIASERLRGTSKSCRLAYLLLIAALALVWSLPLVTWLPDATWHDQQRIGQTFVMTLAAVAVALMFGSGALRPPLLLAAGWRRLLALIIAAGVVSACFAHRPFWAFAEIALGVGSLGIAWVVATMRRIRGVIVDRALLALLVLTCAGLVARFLSAYLSAVIGREGVLNAWLLVDGFSNPRFFGQFLTLGLPLLVVPLLASGELHRYAFVAGLLTVLAWAIAITSGTRGTWLGMAAAAALLACTGPTGRRWASLQAWAAAAGAVLFWVAMTAVPGALSIRTEHHAAARLTASLSQREIIWRQAIEVAYQNPLLGIGPMQLADLPNGVAAHPHQAWLQWAAEWGFPSALLVTWLVARAAWSVASIARTYGESTREQNVLRLCLMGSLAGGLTQAMVDGVLVMPYSQLWVALLGGWLFGLQPQAASSDRVVSEARTASRGSLFSWAAAFAVSVGLLACVVVRDYPHLAEREQAFARSIGGHFQPRFWAQGVINPGRGEAASAVPIRSVSR